jgi:thiol:disulfide interchange protein DsbD
VLGMAVTYAAVGVAAGLSGTLLSAALQNAWVLGSFALVFVVLSLSMFGFYELQMPAALQSRVSDTANRQGGSLPAIALMGALSALIVGPCVAAPLAGALLYIAQTGNAVLGGAALFVMALGMGLPLLLVGAFSRSLLPKSGPWMDGVKNFFGVVMLATALWLVSPVIPMWLQMLGWALLMVVPAIYLHALDPLPPHAHAFQRLGKGLGVALLVGGAAMLIGVLGGARDPLQPLGFLRGATAAVSPAPTFERVATVERLDARLAEAKSAGKAVMLDFYADWCVSCKEMERFTFADPQVAARMQQIVLLKADVTANSDADKELLKRFGLFGPPGIIFFDACGNELVDLRVVGFQPTQEFLPTLERVQR